MKRNYFLVGFVILAAMLVATAIVYPRAPQLVPTHWNIQGVVDGYSNKWTLFVTTPAGILAIMGLFAALPWLSPKRFEVDTFRSTYLYIMIVIVGMMAYFHALLLWAAIKGPMDMNRSITAGVCLLLALLGNVLGKVRRNFYIGIRTPWTLANETVWNATHRLGGKMFFVCGVIGFVLALFRAPFWSVMAILAAGALVPVVYSLVLYKQLERRGEV
ncbi:MAG TPA: SdpI family protein [Candidatus Acidoferrum sp.]|nr:SdpI family protein [Candidatus Acidoferrum sp.]